MQEAAEELNGLIEKAEGLYGPRDASWTFAGINFDPAGPLVVPSSGSKTVQVFLTCPAETHPSLRSFQLAHEAVHLLSPCGQYKDATMLEEGVAVRFSLIGPAYAADPHYRFFAEQDIRKNPKNKNYAEALNLVDRIRDGMPGAIKRLRSIEPSFGAMTPAFLVEQLGVDGAVARRLCERVQMRPRDN